MNKMEICQKVVEFREYREKLQKNHINAIAVDWIERILEARPKQAAVLAEQQIPDVNYQEVPQRFVLVENGTECFNFDLEHKAIFPDQLRQFPHVYPIKKVDFAQARVENPN